MPFATPVLPPAFQLVALDREADAFERARRAAPRGLDDGTVYWTDRADRLSLAVAIEPEAPRAAALRTVHVLGVAAGDALGALGPAEMSLAHAWPGGLVMDGVPVGRVRAAAGPMADAGAVPPWLVLGLEVATGVAGRIAPARLAEDAARRFLAWTRRCREEGFGPVRDAWNARCLGRGAEATFAVAGGCRSGVVDGLDDDGGLRVGGTTLPLEAALAEQG